MAAGGWVRYNIWGEPKKMNKNYWLKQAQYAYDCSVLYPSLNWEQLMYVYLFWSVGYE